MKSYKKMALGGAVLLAAGIFNIAQAATQYTVTALNAPQLLSSQVTGINASGQVLGWGPISQNQTQAFYFDAHATTYLGDFLPTGINDSGDVVGNSGGHAVIYHQGTLANLLVGDTGGSGAYGINNAGQVVGGTGQGAFLYEAGHMTWLPAPLGSTSIGASAISNSGYITGAAATANDQQPFLYKDGTTLGLGTLGGTYARGIDVNDLGQIAGESFTSNGKMHAFLYTNHQMLDIHPAGAEGSSAAGVNSAGQVVGTFSFNFSGFPGGAEFHGFLYTNGTTVDLNSLIDPTSGWTVNVVQGINDSGQIAATGCNGSRCTALLLTPVPEPATVLYLVLGLGLLGVMKRRRSP